MINFDRLIYSSSMKHFLLTLSIVIGCSLLASCEKETMLSVSQSSISFDNKGGNASFNITANKVWSASSNQSWCKVSPSSGDGSEYSTFTLSVSSDANTTYDERSCMITITCEELTKTVVVYQSKEKVLLPSMAEYIISSEAQTIDVEVNSNINFDVAIHDSCKEWMSIISTKGLSSKIISISVDENVGKARDGKVLFIGDEIQKEILIKQGEAIVAFADANFKAYCIKEFDENRDGELSMSEAIKISIIGVDTDNISSLKGIEYMPNLKVLTCVGRNNHGGLTNLDVSKNIALTYLHCALNHLTELDVSNNTALTMLSCGFNDLTNINLSNNPLLEKLYCEYNQLSSLDVSKNTALLTLSCPFNPPLTSLDVSKNVALKFLDYSSNPQLHIIDITKNVALESLCCAFNQLTNLDISTNPLLKEIHCGNNYLSKLDISKNNSLETLNCTFNQLTYLDISKNTSLKIIYCDNNRLTSLDVSSNPMLTTIWCFSNPFLTEIWLKTGQTIADFQYDTDVATIKYK